MKNNTLLLLLAFFTAQLFAQSPQTIFLKEPDLTRGSGVMRALSVRASASDFDTTNIGLPDLSDLLWAANGINRPESGKRTAPSAVNAQDIDVYVCMDNGVYLYDAKKHLLNLIINGDYRKLAAGRQENVAKAPVICLLISDISRFKFGSDSLKKVWAAEDAGIVSQNIALFCASVGLATRPRITMDESKLHQVLHLTKTQYLMLNNPVSKKKE